MLAVYMTPRSTFPDAFPSNSLFGAICRGMGELGDDPGPLIESYEKNPPFYISSCFPFLGRKDPLPLYPMPMLPLHEVPGLNFDTFKSLKKVRWIDQSTFRKLSEGSLTPAKLVQEWNTFQYDSKKGILISKGEKRGDFTKVDIPHNHINRLSVASEQFYHSSGTHYRESGLWFLIDFIDTSWEKAVRASLCLLSDQGIGSRRSTGQGSFEISFSPSPVQGHRDAPYLMTLSRFLPESFSSFRGKIWYDLVTIRGRTQDGVAKKEVLMFSEGSFFQNTGKPWYGRIARVRESPPMVEYGVAFPIGMRCMG